MQGINKVSLLGNVTKEVTLRTTNGGQSVATVDLATNETYKDKSGKSVETVAFHRVTVFGAAADNAAKYLVKGQTVFVEGKLAYSSFDDKDTGKKVFKTDIIALNVIYLGKPGGAEKSNSGFKSNGNGAKKYAVKDDDGFGAGVSDDEIPF